MRVLGEVAVGVDEVLCAVRRDAVAGCWATGLDSRVGGRCWDLDLVVLEWR